MAGILPRCLIESRLEFSSPQNSCSNGCHWDCDAGRYADGFEDVLREVALMKKLSHRNLVSLHEVIDGPDSEGHYLGGAGSVIQRPIGDAAPGSRVGDGRIFACWFPRGVATMVSWFV